jgi:leader peptidase (prepilin peptidase)/N-methyltransferase
VEPAGRVAAASTGIPRTLGRDRKTWWAGPLALALAAVTFVHLGHGANAALWALVQVVLVAVAAIDVEIRKIPNVITYPVAVLAVVLRVGFERAALLEVAIAGFGAFAIFLLLSLPLKGGLGMGDVKLAGMLGFLLGRAVIPALVFGVFAGGIWSAILLLTHRAGMRSTIAYGPFLALGGSAAVLLSTPPNLV